jgi:DNA gyrase subunit B
MYIGRTTNPNHLIYELLDNALDEAQAGHATLIGIQIDTVNNTVAIADNGRGIPWQNDTIPTIATKLFSGGKFDKGSDKSYGIASGLHGIGIVAVTALSDEMKIEVFRDKKHVCYEFKDAKVSDSKIKSHKGSKPFSTQVTFKPSKKYFESLDFDAKDIRERLKIASVHVPKLSLILFIDGKKEVIKDDINTFFKKEVLQTEFVKAGTTKIIDLKHKIKDESVHIRCCWDFDNTSTARNMGCVNILKVNQGTHINCALEVIRNVLYEIVQKEKLKNVTKADCTTFFRSYTSLMLYAPEYDSQTKDSLSVSKSKIKHLFTPLEDKFRKILKDDESLKNQLMASFDAYRRRLSSRKALVKTNGTVTRLTNIIDSKLKDCTSHNVNQTELFIVEGQSAGGTLGQCRDPRYHAVLGLRGKILNVADAKKDYLKNKEVVEIINAIGTGVEPDFNEAGLRYGKIILTLDADHDGAHIASLLMTLFLRIAPKLLEQGVIYMAQLPLYGAQQGKTFTPLYSDADVENFRKANPKVKLQRYKGLGEMDPHQLKVCLLDPTRRLIKIDPPTNKSIVYKLMSDPELKRKLV